jgi:hypothetical protein
VRKISGVDVRLAVVVAGVGESGAHGGHVFLPRCAGVGRERWRVGVSGLVMAHSQRVVQGRRGG